MVSRDLSRKWGEGCLVCAFVGHGGQEIRAQTQQLLSDSKSVTALGAERTSSLHVLATAVSSATTAICITCFSIQRKGFSLLFGVFFLVWG